MRVRGADLPNCVRAMPLGLAALGLLVLFRLHGSTVDRHLNTLRSSGACLLHGVDAAAQG